MQKLARDLRIDIREAVEECRIWMEAVQTALEIGRTKTDDRDCQRHLAMLGKFVAEADAATRHLDSLIADLLDLDVDTSAPTTGGKLVIEAINYYARGGRDSGKRAQRALQEMFPEGEDEGDLE